MFTFINICIIGWGQCGIDISAANDQFKLITAEFNPSDHGKYTYTYMYTNVCICIYQYVHIYVFIHMYF
jgi:hypothetical protein